MKLYTAIPILGLAASLVTARTSDESLFAQEKLQVEVPGHLQAHQDAHHHSGKNQSHSQSSSLCTVNAQQGKIIGSFFAPFPSCSFKGIPFGQAPVNELRFAPPRPALKFPNGEFLATEYGPGCIQECTLQHPFLTCPRSTSEDCLSLNIYTPNTKPKSPFPVIVFIHGGNYISGSGGVKLYHGSRFAHENKVIVVTINYRLGALGGLFVKHIRGNLQLQDQRLALRWVQQNIGQFGGNVKKVIISGQSAGAFSVASHLASPKSFDYFQGAIIMSDPIALPEETTSKAAQLGKIFLNKIGCNHHSEKKIDECLRSQPASRILDVQQNVSFPTMPGLLLHKFMPWTPVLTPEELPISPMQAAAKGKLAKVPIMIGSTANESVQFIWEAFPDKTMSHLEYETYVDLIFGPLNARKIFELYGRAPKDTDNRLLLSTVGTDYIFSCSTRKFAQDAAAANLPVYVYYFNQLPSYNEYLQGHWLPECHKWVCHGVDLPVLFDTVYTLEEEPDHPYPNFQEGLLSRHMQTIWSNFATSGDPNSPRNLPRQLGENEIVSIPSVNSQPNNVYELSVPTRIHSNFKHEACQLFDKLGYEKN